jgi:hypothetical protein
MARAIAERARVGKGKAGMGGGPERLAENRVALFLEIL